ncbi:hypothetical protein [Planktomarina sp.]|uniref:hypothetical protein n=1 Tax=Planktomarina sp. TaxID=2024851 RepID=UPI003260A56D
MAKVKLTKIADRFESSFDSFLNLAKRKLSAEMLTGKGRNTWVNEEGQKILVDCMYIEEIIPKHFKGKVLAEAPNPSYVFAYIDEIKMKVPVVIPRKYKGKMNGKTITIEMIEDVRGRSYRYVA